MLTFASKRRPWAFVMPIIALGLGPSTDDQVGEPVGLLVVALTGLSCGAAWQLLYRRDLVDRLTYFAAFFVVAMALAAVVPDVHVSSASAGSSVAISGVLAGLVYAEQWLRDRAERSVKGGPQGSVSRGPSPSRTHEGQSEGG